MRDSKWWKRKASFSPGRWSADWRRSALALAVWAPLVAGSLLAAPASANNIAVPGDIGFVAEINTGTGGKFAIHNLAFSAQITGISITLGDNALFDTAAGPSGSGDVDPVLQPLLVATALNPIPNMDPGGFGFDFEVTGEDVGFVGVFGIADGAFTVSFDFTGFDPGESWGFFVDYDTRDGVHIFPNGRGNTDTRVFDGAMTNAALSISFSDGTTLDFAYDPNPNGRAVSFPALSLTRNVVVPEPAAISLLGCGLLLGGLAMHRRR